MTDHSGRLTDLRRFYALLHELEQFIGGPRTLARCSGRMDWPRRGIYFFTEPGENRSDTGRGPRIVRVGTHALISGAGTRLWSRLSQHKGVERTGGGNHRGSIFRLIVGNALIGKHCFECRTWGHGSTAKASLRRSEQYIEIEVTKLIGAMPFLWLRIDDKPGAGSCRGYLERNAIALLSNFNKNPLDPPSSSWLGLRCDKEKVRKSGLWNQNHVEESYDPAFLKTFEKLIEDMAP